MRSGGQCVMNGKYFSVDEKEMLERCDSGHRDIPAKRPLVLL